VSFDGVAEACQGIRGTPSAAEVSARPSAARNLARPRPPSLTPSPPSLTRQCDVCAGALLSAFAPKLPELGFSCDDIAALDSDSLTSTLTPCISVVLGPLQAAGVSTTSLLALRSCPSEPGENVRAAALSACPELADELD
jgi:hypothetical protein